MPDVEVRPSAACLPEPSQIAQDAGDQRAPEAATRRLEQVEQLARSLAVEDAPEAIMLDHRLGPIAKMIEVSQAYAVNPRGKTALGPSPDKAGYVEEDWRVVGHERAPIPVSPVRVNATRPDLNETVPEQ